MSLVTVSSAKGSPGATTTALVLAHMWPAGRVRVVVECDPSGGDLALRLGVPATPGLLSLAAGLREGLTADELHRHARTLPRGELAILGPAGEVEAGSAVAVCAAALASIAAGSEALDLIVDCGRLAGGSQGESLVRAADVSVVVSRLSSRPHDTAASLRHALDVVARVQNLNTGIVLVGRGPCAQAEVEEAVGAPVVGRLPIDRRAVDRLMTPPVGRRDDWFLGRLPLFRAAATVVSGVVASLARAERRSPGSSADTGATALGTEEAS